ncbi:MOSC domain-containing protein [Sphingomonas sp. Leaf10]|uniref:MOSC domain-containing protein n=1 Tax=Sphingomonas sp. Leaf10 TaxID=1735676 RepID=UPI0006F27303|nr:MOSC domain-containing protein [Sphingomonas sp. Leaf10]KQM41442.1 molybdenum cofactor biosysynthesis protein [Sphingomonas sp. Leaf10]
MAGGILKGIARHAFSRGPIELVQTVRVTVETGLDGDFRGALKPGRNNRQVSLMEVGDWAQAMREVGHDLPWWERRANLLVEDFDLPQTRGAFVRVGPVLLEITKECDPCSRMETIVEGLRGALIPDWRGGALARVIEGGQIRVGDPVRNEKPSVHPE